VSLQKFFFDLQNSICSEINKQEIKQFEIDDWNKSSSNQLKGNGRTRIIEDGFVFERGGVNFSHVFGKKLPPSATKSRPELEGRPFEAMGLSLVFHPQNPYIPTVHMNIRFFIAHPKNKDESEVWWFGGGMDLTPYYLFEEDAKHFHKCCKDVLDPYSSEYYANFKKNCDEYFYLKHRGETRGVGGIFFDDFSELGFEKSFDMVRAVGNSFLKAYIPIVIRRKNLVFGDREKDFQLYRRGRYVEFNLVYDRGTIFGLQSGGRIESILMSMPPSVSWKYNFAPEVGSAEEKLYQFLKPVNWLEI
jgi:coproporphyrinogen III oxidase